MKKTIALLLALCLCACLCACGADAPSKNPSNDTTQTSQTNTPIVLTTENWSEYLDIDVELVKFYTVEQGGKYEYGCADFEVNITGKSAAYTFCDVAIEVRVYSENHNWTMRARDVEASLPADGNAALAEMLRSEQAFVGDVVAPELLVNVKKISGTVEVSP